MTVVKQIDVDNKTSFKFHGACLRRTNDVTAYIGLLDSINFRLV